MLSSMSLLFVQLLTLCTAGVPPMLARQPLASANATSPWPFKQFLTEAFVAPVFNVTHNGPTSPGYLFLTPDGPTSNTNASMIVANDGQLVWHGGLSNFYTNLRTQAYHNQTYLTFWNSSIGGPTRGNGYGAVEFLDSSYKLAYRICLAELNIVTPTGVKWSCNVDLHEAQMTSRHTLLVTVYNVTQADLTSVQGPKNGWILDTQFYEVDVCSEKILFSWKH